MDEKLEDFRENTQFIVMCGMHGSEAGQLQKADMTLVDNYHKMFEDFHRHPELVKIIKNRRYEMGIVLELRTKVKEVDKIDGHGSSQNELESLPDNTQCPTTITNYTLQEHSKSAIKMLFNSLLSNQLPIVLILASCWSFQSEMSNILRASGLFSVLNVAEERGKITAGKMLQLDNQQQEVLRTIINDERIKDAILGGMNLVNIVCTLISLAHCSDWLGLAQLG